MYLSRLILNPRTRRVQRELAQPYEMHRSIMYAFRTDLQQGEERVLWRVDVHPHLGLTLLVQSWDAPDWTWLTKTGAPGYLLLLNEPNPTIKALDLKPSVGQTLSFRLRANPTRRLSAGTGNNGKRVGIYDEEDQLAWLARKGEQHGFRVLQAQVSRDGKIKDEKKVKPLDANGDAPNIEGNSKIDPPKSSYKLELLSVQFDGILQVTDPDKLIAAVQTGIGSGKGFGFGLLSLAPARG